MDFRKILLESKIDDFKNKYGSKFGNDTQRVVDMIYPKFLDWVGKNLETMNFSENLIKVSNTLDRFEKISSNLTKKDINQYKSIQELVDAIKSWDNREKRQYEAVQGGNLVYQDDRFYVVNPLTHEASCYYGRGTKWCTAAQTDVHFKNYNDDSKLFYIIDKRLQTDDPYYKVAIVKRFDGGEQYWDAADRQFTSGWVLGTDEYKKIGSAISEYLEKEFASQLKIYRDKEEAKKERDRVQRLQIQRERNRKEADAFSRREDNEWELGPNCPEEGLKAHALLKWLEDTSDVGIINLETSNEIQRLRDEIERLNNEYDASEETDTDILDEINDLEEQLDELITENIDVYQIIPESSHYDMDTFIVFNPNLEGREYAVGTEDEVRSSAYDYVDQLIDDMGYEGFARGFAEDYIDTEQVVDEAREFYDNDVRDSGESYFDESDRELSRQQNGEISIKENKIQSYKSQIEKLNTILDDTEDEDDIEDIEEKISELEDMIYELESEIEDIRENPEGDFPEEMIDDKVEEILDNVRSDPRSFLDELGLDWSNYIDKDEFIKGVIDADGYGHTLNSYDGTADEVEVEGTTYYVMRIN